MSARRVADEAAMRDRVQTVRAVVHGLDDTGPEQMLVVEAHAGMPRQAVPVHHPFGFSSSVPLDGAVTMLHAAGADQADLVAHPPSNPSQGRFGGLLEGETVAYDAAGQRLHFRNGTLVEVQATTEFSVSIGGSAVFTLTAAGATLNVPLKVNGTIAATGDVTAGSISLQQHRNSGVQPGSGTSGPPE